MSVLDALYQAVLAEPADDTPRLVYADALEEAGEADRAWFVRGQVELARSAEWEPAWVRASFYPHERALISGGGWTLTLPNLPAGVTWAQEAFRRGFPGALRVSDAGAFVRAADELFAEYPIDALELVGLRQEDVAVLERCGWLGRIGRLVLANGAGRQLTRRLLAVRGFGGVTDLRVGPAVSTQETAGAVLRSRVFPRLTTLAYRDEQGRAIMDGLARVAGPSPLRTLDLSGNRLDCGAPAAAAALGSLLVSPVMAGVETLDLTENRLGVEGVRELAAAQPPALRALRLMRTRPGDGGVGVLAASGLLIGLRLLSLAGNNLAAIAAKTLAGAPAAAGLRVLDLTANRLGDDGAVSLARCEHLGELLALDLAENGVGDAGAVALAQSPHLGGLLALDLRSNPAVGPAARNRLLDRFGSRVLL